MRVTVTIDMGDQSETVTMTCGSSRQEYLDAVHKAAKRAELAIYGPTLETETGRHYTV